MTTGRKIISVGFAASLIAVGGAAVGTPAVAQEGGVVVDTAAPGAPSYVFTEKTVSGPGRGVTVFWGRSTDNVGIAEYWIYVNGQAIAVRSGSERQVTIPDLPATHNFIQVAALDSAGNWSKRTSPTYVQIDRDPPTAPTDLQLESLDLDYMRFTFEPAIDLTSVRYRVWINGRTDDSLGLIYAYPLYDGTSRWAIDIERPRSQGTWYFQLTAEDSDRNVSRKSPPLRVEIPYFDTSRPAAPVVTAEVIQYKYVELSWETPYDNVGVTEYVVVETGIGPWGPIQREVAITGATSFGAPPLVAGPAWYQVMAVDEQGNRSAKSAPIRVQYPLVPAII